ncbi:hypothetical protein SAY87_015144 [Trapa incisa]|uniref:Uncharacterized protein n=1 Tax=Trapa incisa TaxID=236973 RepID=A0AAN7GQ47_9MYRT|nr:hypothetical protein SAY87_015144 [Trapa incisa]
MSLEDSKNLAAGNALHLSNAVRITKNNADLSTPSSGTCKCSPPPEPTGSLELGPSACKCQVGRYDSSTARRDKIHRKVKDRGLQQRMGMVDASLGDHSGDEVLGTDPDPAVGADVNLTDPLVELGGLELFANGSDDVAEIGDGDEARGNLVEDLEGVAELTVEGRGSD